MRQDVAGREPVLPAGAAEGGGSSSASGRWFQIRWLRVNMPMAVAPSSTALLTAFWTPPAIDTCAPMRFTLPSSLGGPCRGFMPGTTLRASPMDVQNRERSKPAEVPSADELERYESDGYLVVRQVLSDQHLDPIRRVMERTVERQADEWYEQGLIADRCRDEPFERRYGALRAQLPPTFSNSWRRILVSPEIHPVWQYPPLVGLMRRLIGDELYASVIWNGRHARRSSRCRRSTGIRTPTTCRNTTRRRIGRSARGCRWCRSTNPPAACR